MLHLPRLPEARAATAALSPKARKHGLLFYFILSILRSLLGPSLHHSAQQSWSREGAVHHKPCTGRVTADTVAATTLDTVRGEAPNHTKSFAGDSPRGQTSSLAASPEEKLSIPFPRLLRNHGVSLRLFFGFVFLLLSFLRRDLQGGNPGTGIYDLTGDKNAPFVKYKGAPKRT